MKIIPLGLKSKEKDFELECSLLRDLHHPGIIALHQAFVDSYDSQRCGFIVTDIADGEAFFFAPLYHPTLLC